MHAQVGLLVAVEVHAPYRDATGDRRFPDAGLDLTSVPFHDPAPADVHRHHHARDIVLHERHSMRSEMTVVPFA